MTYTKKLSEIIRKKCIDNVKNMEIMGDFCYYIIMWILIIFFIIAMGSFIVEIIKLKLS